MFIEQSLTDQAVRWVMNMIALIPIVIAVGVLGTIALVVVYHTKNRAKVNKYREQIASVRGLFAIIRCNKLRRR